MAVTSLDGFITFHRRGGSDWASPADQAHFREALQSFDCSICGAGTFRQAQEAILSSLSRNRLRVVITRNPGKFLEIAQPGLLEFSDDSPKSIISSLSTRGYRRCALLGGSQIYSIFQDAKLIDQWWTTVEARIFGCGLPLVPGRWSQTLNLLSVERIGPDTVCLKYQSVFQ